MRAHECRGRGGGEDADPTGCNLTIKMARRARGRMDHGPAPESRPSEAGPWWRGRSKPTPVAIRPPVQGARKGRLDAGRPAGRALAGENGQVGFFTSSTALQWHQRIRTVRYQDRSGRNGECEGPASPIRSEPRCAQSRIGDCRLDTPHRFPSPPWGLLSTKAKPAGQGRCHPRPSSPYCIRTHLAPILHLRSKPRPASGIVDPQAD